VRLLEPRAARLGILGPADERVQRVLQAHLLQRVLQPLLHLASTPVRPHAAAARRRPGRPPGDIGGLWFRAVLGRGKGEGGRLGGLPWLLGSRLGEGGGQGFAQALLDGELGAEAADRGRLERDGRVRSDSVASNILEHRASCERAFTKRG
jgi:hypothetical protein